jgi:hypothetical protein
MSDRVMWQGDNPVTSASQQAGAAQPRKITADSFRSLTARLKSPGPAIEIPDIRPQNRPIVPQPIAAEPVIVAPVVPEIPEPEIAPVTVRHTTIQSATYEPAETSPAVTQTSVFVEPAPQVITSVPIQSDSMSLKDQWTEQVYLPVQAPPVFKSVPSFEPASAPDQSPNSLVIGADRISSILTRNEPSDLASLKLPPILPPPEPPAPKAPELPKAAIETLVTDHPIQAFTRRKLAPSDPELDQVMRMIAALPSLEERAAYLEEVAIYEQQQAAQAPEQVAPAEDLEALALQHVAEYEQHPLTEAAPLEVAESQPAEEIWGEPEQDTYAVVEAAVPVVGQELEMAEIAEAISAPAESISVPDIPFVEVETPEAKKNSFDEPLVAEDLAHFESPVAEAQASLAADTRANQLQEQAEPARLRKPAAPTPRTAAPAHVAINMSDAEIEDLGRSLLDMMASGVNAGLPQERALAADTLLRLVPQLQLRPLVHLAERLAMMESPPHMIAGKLLMDHRIEVSGPLLENGTSISDQDLFPVVEEGNHQKLRLLARRRKLSRTLSDMLVKVDNTSVLLTLVRNAHAEISHEGFLSLTASAASEHDLLAPLCTRADLPAPQAFELFWLAPAQLRRYLLSRFLTDSQTLTKILKITMATQGDRQSSEQFADAAEVKAALGFIVDGNLDAASEKIAPMAQIDPQTAKRIISDSLGEPLIALLKSLGYLRADLDELILSLQRSDNGTINPNRERSELTGLFDTLSFNKARILLTYWDWATLRTGPYAPVH